MRQQHNKCAPPLLPPALVSSCSGGSCGASCLCYCHGPFPRRHRPLSVALEWVLPEALGLLARRPNLLPPLFLMISRAFPLTLIDTEGDERANLEYAAHLRSRLTRIGKAPQLSSKQNISPSADAFSSMRAVINNPRRGSSHCPAGKGERARASHPEPAGELPRLS